MASLTIDEIRQWIRDYPEANNLIGDVEFTNANIERAIDFVIDDINAVPPLDIVFDKATFPYRNILLMGVVVHLYIGQAFHQERNHLPASTGGISIDDKSHSQAYTQLASNLSAKFERQVKEIKIAINFNRGWGGIHSEYPSRL